MSGLALSGPAGAAIIYSVGGQTTGTMSAVSGGTVTTTATGGNPSSVTVTPSGFANVLVGKSATGTVVIDNIIDTVVSGSNRSVTFSFTSVTPNAGVSATITQGSNGILTAGTNRTVTVTATPTVRGSTLAGTFTVSGSSPGVAAGNVGKSTSSDTTNVTVNVVGRSSVASQTGNVTVYVLPGASTSQAFTVKNIGDGTLAGTDTSTFKSELWGSTSVTNGTGWTGSALTFNATTSNLTDTGAASDSTTASFVYTGATTRGNSGTASITATYTSGGTNNTGSTAVTVLTGVTVAPVASTTTTGTGSTTYVLVGSGATVTGSMTVKNIGDGTLANTNLSGSLATTLSTGFKASAADGAISLGDSNNAGPNGTSLTQTLTYTAEAARSGALRTGSSAATFSNGSVDGKNSAAASLTVGFSAQTVAPQASTTATPTSFGTVRVGTTSTASLTVKNVGDGNLFGKDNGTTVLTNLRGNVSVSGTSAITGGGAVNLTDGSSQTYMFTYAPTARGTQSGTLTTALTNGAANGTNAASTASSTVSGTAVGPVYDASVAGKNASSGPIINGGTIQFGDAVGGLTLQDLLISNLSNDNASKALTDLTLTNVTITGSTEFSFSLSGFDSGNTGSYGTSTKNAVLSNLFNGDGKGAISIQFVSKTGGYSSAQLRIETDEGAALGGAGAVYVYNLVWTVPEPGTIAVFGAGLLGLAISRQRRRGRAFAALTANPKEDTPQGAA